MLKLKSKVCAAVYRCKLSIFKTCYYFVVVVSSTLQILVCGTDSGRGQCDLTVMVPVRGSFVTSSRSTAELSIPDTFNPQLPLVFGSFERDGTTVRRIELSLYCYLLFSCSCSSLVL